MSSQQFQQNANSIEPIRQPLTNSLNTFNINTKPPKNINTKNNNNEEEEQECEPFSFDHTNRLADPKEPIKEDHIKFIKIEEESNEEDDQDDPQENSNSQEDVKIQRKKKKCRDQKYILDNVKVNKLKNFYKTFMNRIAPVLKEINRKDSSMVQLIEEICQQSNQRSFLDLFPHLKPCHEQDSSYFTYKNSNQLNLLRKDAFKLFGLKFNQMVRIIKSSKSFKQTEEFIYGCLFFAQSSEHYHKKQNLPPNILEIVSLHKPFYNFEFQEPSLICGQETEEKIQQKKGQEEKYQNQNNKKQQQLLKEFEQKIKSSKIEGQEILKSSSQSEQNIEKETNPHDLQQSNNSGSQNDSLIEQEETEDDGSIHFFQGLTIKSNGAIQFQNNSRDSNFP